MSDPGASSQTLSTEQLVPSFFFPSRLGPALTILNNASSDNGLTSVPYDLVDLILSQAIAEVIHETVDTAVSSLSIPQALFSSRNFLGTLAGVSTSFRVIVLRLVALAFQIPLPCERILLEAHGQVRSLLLFKGAMLAGAVMNPPEVWSPLMKAYGYHLRARFLIHSALRRKSEISLALKLCGATGGLSRLLVDALNSQLGDGSTLLSFSSFCSC
ncbi:hypothetical protein B0H12DRAFT_1116611 [Mycena haematopus]|nr:hypothetical protein B0H12DRAFT_1116611 [Mycena haematopus]